MTLGWGRLVDVSSPQQTSLRGGTGYWGRDVPTPIPPALCFFAPLLLIPPMAGVRANVTTISLPELRFMGSPLFLTDLHTAHEPDRVCAVLRRRKQCGRCRSLVPCARWEDWFRWWITVHFGEAREGFPVGKICLLSELHRAFGVGPKRTI